MRTRVTTAGSEKSASMSALYGVTRTQHHSEVYSTCEQLSLFPAGNTSRSNLPLSSEQCIPHSLATPISHHQRPARGSSPAEVGRVHGAQPMLVYPWS